MTEIVPFKAEHLKYILRTGMVDVKFQPFLKPELAEVLEGQNKHFAALDDGICVAVGGVTEIWPGRGEAWVIFGKPRRQHFVTLFKMVQRYLQLSNLRRLEMVVDYDFDAGHRWARLLGFKVEGERLQGYMPHGGDVTLYAIVRK